jgi:hypothetical protein
MSIGFNDGVNEFHTTTAHAPHSTALPDLMRILSAMASEGGGGAASDEYILQWNRDPEEFDFHFIRNGTDLTINIYQYPTDQRDDDARELVYSYTGPLHEIISAFSTTFTQLYEDRDTDEFESNWHQPFPYKEYEHFKTSYS